MLLKMLLVPGMKSYVNSYQIMDSREKKFNNTSFIMGKGKDLCLPQIYFDDTMFTATNYELYKEFSDLKGKEFEKVLVDDLTFWLDY